MYSLGKHIKFMRELHRGQTDKIGAPYWRHPLRVMKTINKEIIHNLPDGRKLCPEFIQIILSVALFHDVIEDVENGQERLNSYLQNEMPNLAEKIMARVGLLTRPELMPYDEYIDRVLNCESGVVLAVKISDVLDNFQRLDLIEDKNIRDRLWKKYNNVLKKAEKQKLIWKKNQEH